MIFNVIFSSDTAVFASLLISKLEATTVKEPTFQQDPVDIGLLDRDSSNVTQGKEILLSLILQRYHIILTLNRVNKGLHYTQFLEYEKQCSDCQECKFDSNGWTLGGSGHTEVECLESCKQKDACRFASISSTGYCHMTRTCKQKGSDSSGWTRFKKIGTKYIVYVLAQF